MVRSPPSRLLGNRDAASVDFFEDGVAASAQQGFADCAAQCFRIVSIARLAQDLRAIRVGDNSIKMQAAIPNLSRGADGNLATSTQFVQQGALTSGGGAGIGVVGK